MINLLSYTSLGKDYYNMNTWIMNFRNRTLHSPIPKRTNNKYLVCKFVGLDSQALLLLINPFIRLLSSPSSPPLARGYYEAGAKRESCSRLSSPINPKYSHSNNHLDSCLSHHPDYNKPMSVPTDMSSFVFSSNYKERTRHRAAVSSFHENKKL